MIRVGRHETVFLSLNWSGGPSFSLQFFPFGVNLGFCYGFAWFHFQVHYGEHAWRNVLVWSSAP